jgi:hypothetical protein
MKKHIFLLFAITMVFLVFQARCASVGTNANTSQIETIQKGVTTRADVEVKLGQPNMVSLMGDGRKIILYNYSEYRTEAGTFIPFVGLVVFGANTQNQTLQIMLDQRDVVVDYVYTNTPGAVRIR